MSPLVLLTYYCLLILGMSIVGGMIPLWFRLTHRVMECVVSFVAGVMLGVGALHMLPHALTQSLAATQSPQHETILQVMLWFLAGLLTMFFIERFLCFHHHEVEDGEVTCGHDHDGQHNHGHDITWSGAAIGLTLHSVIAGIALAASVDHGQANPSLAGLGTFFVILLHKPFDSMTIAALMARGGWSLPWRHAVNGLFSLAIPLGAVLFYVGIAREGDGGATLGAALAFAAGAFLCIALSDLLPELQFHNHDRVLLSTALLLGLALAYGICRLEELSHSHTPAPSVTAAAEIETPKRLKR
ncbi:MAG: ZIP family metal transporter [Planctomycetota bacterium]